MKRKTTYLKSVILFTIVICCFTTCKKYPENRLWFSNPEKLTPFNGYITAYKINGNDSLDALNKYIDRSSGLNGDVRAFEFLEPYNKRENSVTIVSYATSGHFTFPLDYIFLSKQKKIQIYCGLGTNNSYPPNNIPLMSKNLFVESGLVWDIIKLKNKGDFKIRTIHNSNTYEITIN